MQVLQSESVAKCKCYKVQVLQSASVAKCKCCKVQVLQSTSVTDKQANRETNKQRDIVTAVCLCRWIVWVDEEVKLKSWKCGSIYSARLIYFRYLAFIGAIKSGVQTTNLLIV